MTDENKNQIIRNEIERAGKAMGAAVVLLENGFLNDAVSKLYYYLYYHVRALLLTKGIEAKKHEGALSLLGRHFVREGIVDAKASHVFSELIKFRDESDCNPTHPFTRDEAAEFKKQAEHLAGAIKAYLKEKGRL
jgi:hypothetical protein